MSGRTRALLTVAVFALAMPAGAQAPSPGSTANMWAYPHT